MGLLLSWFTPLLMSALISTLSHPFLKLCPSPTYLIHLTHINALLCLNYLELNFEL